MLNTFLELKEPLIYISKITRNIDYNRIFLNDRDWFILSQLIRIFEVFIKPTIKLQGQVYITLPKALLYIYQIYNKLEGLVRNFRSQIASNIDLVSFLSYLI